MEELKLNFRRIQLERYVKVNKLNLYSFTCKLIDSEEERVRYAYDVSGTIEEASEMLNMSLRTFFRKLEKYNLNKFKDYE